ncbi:MAG: type II secretion system F family protein, partial [bacterium]|nr:type II secretion system F family protein [bacterium]
MARFTYTAEKAGGELYKGVADAPDRFALYGIVRQEGGKIISVEESKNNWLDLKYWNSFLSRVTEYEKILFARNMGAMLEAGLPLARALAVIERQTKNARMSTIVSSIESDIRRGDTLHAAFAKFPHVFSKLFVAMIRAGEEGGDLPASLKVVSDQMERMYALKKKIRGALIYPTIIMIAVVGIGFLMMTQVVPTLAQTFAEAGADLPKSTQFVIGLSNFLVDNTILALGIIIGAIASVYFIAHTKQGRRGFDFTFLHIPLIGSMVREVNAARMSRTMASLLSAGVDVLTALEIVGDVVQNSYFREVIKDSARGVGSGEPLSASFIRREDLYPAFVGEMMAVGEETGQI